MKFGKQQVAVAHGQSVGGLELLLERYPAAELETRHNLAASENLSARQDTRTATEG
jgi:hypothetical protein